MDEPKRRMRVVKIDGQLVAQDVVLCDDPAIVQALAIRQACAEAGLLDADGRLRDHTSSSVSRSHPLEWSLDVTVPACHGIVYFFVPWSTREAAERAAKGATDGQ